MAGFFKRIQDWLARVIKSQITRRVLQGLLGLLVVIALILALWWVPKWQLSGETKLQPEKRIELENNLRKTLAQIFGGFFVFFAAYFAWRRIVELERTVEVTEQGQITERFTRAIGQLGDRKNLEVRLGGIYALERIAKDSPKDHWTIMEVLTAYIREKAPWEGNPSPDGTAGSSSVRRDRVWRPARGSCRGRRFFGSSPDRTGVVFHLPARRR